MITVDLLPTKSLILVLRFWQKVLKVDAALDRKIQELQVVL